MPELPSRLQALRLGLRRRLGFSQAEARDVDAEQAFLRALIGAGILIYALYVVMSGAELGRTLQLTVIAASIPLLAGLFMLAWFRRHEARPTAMRYFAICADLIPLTVGLWGADDYGVPLVGLYLWVTVGNGFRFGPRMLMFSYWVSIACFLALLLFGPFWQAHRAIGIGFGLVLASIPLYVLVLLSRLTAQKDAALELSNAKSRFVANVSHELRTPLTGVFAVYELLRRRRLAPDERALVGSLGNAIGTLKSSVDAILQMSKLEAGAEQTTPRLFNLLHFLQRTALLVRPQAAAKHLAWSVDMDGSIEATAFGDASHLQHVLGNLVNNALKFTPAGSVGLRVSRNGELVRFEVTDSGIGIPLDKQETLFERFVQADATATRRYGGTGLGTSIAHDLVRLMGGDIGVVSAPGRGSTFWFTVPFFRTPVDEAPAASDGRLFVRIVGAPDSARDVVARVIASLDYEYAVLDFDEPPDEHVPSARVVTVLVATVAEACAYAARCDDIRATSAWVIADNATSLHQRAAAFRSGACGVVSPAAGPTEWSGLLTGLEHAMALFEATDDAAPGAAAVASIRILLADDNQSNQMLLARMLTDAGHRVELVDSGGSAFDRMAAGDLDLAFLDLNMPDMTGPDVVKLHRASEVGTGRHLPVVILSADATAAAREESLAAGADHYLTKPVTVNALLSVIDHVMAGARARTGRPAAQEPAKSGENDLELRIVQPDPASPVDLIDYDRLESLRRIANHDVTFLRRYMQAAFEDIEAAIADLQHAVQSGNVRAGRDALHKIDGTGSSVGATALLASAAAMRNYLTTTPDSDAASALAELTTVCTLTKSAMAAVTLDSSSANRP